MTGHRLIAILLLALPLAACGHDGVPQIEYRTVNVPVRAPCPDPAVKAAVDAARPVPLRDQPRPADAALALAAEREQLRRYEARDGWADQVQAVLDDCASRSPLVVQEGGE